METEQMYLTFELGKEHFALDVKTVKEVLEYDSFTRVPRMPKEMKGVINIRGSVVPVIDFAQKMGLNPIGKSEHSRIILLEVEHEDELLVTGILADRVNEVVEIQQKDIAPPPSMGTIQESHYVIGVGKRGSDFILLLDLTKVLSG